jgi:hypothetical protein
VAFAVEYAEKLAPWAYGFAVLVSHDAADLVEMGEIVRNPGGEKLRESYSAERRMQARTVEIVRLQVQGAQLAEIFCALPRKFIQQLRKRFVFAPVFTAHPIERLEGASVGKCKDMFRTRQPVHVVSVHQMSDDSRSGPGFLAFVAIDPKFGQIAKERIESCGHAGKKRKRCIEIRVIVLGHFSSMSSNYLKTEVPRAAAGDRLGLEISGILVAGILLILKAKKLMGSAQKRTGSTK